MRRSRIVTALCLIALYAFLAVVLPHVAAASTYATSCPDPASAIDPAVATSCLALAERIEAVEVTTAAGATLNHSDLMVLVGVVLGGSFLPMLVRQIFGGRGE